MLVRECMTLYPVRVRPTLPAAKAKQLMNENDVYHLLHSLQLMLGLPARGVRVTVRMPDRPSEFAKLSAVLGRQGWGIMGIGTFPAPRQPEHRDAVIQITHVTPDEVAAVLHSVPEQTIVDIR